MGGRWGGDGGCNVFEKREANKSQLSKDAPFGDNHMGSGMTFCFSLEVCQEPKKGIPQQEIPGTDGFGHLGLSHLPKGWAMNMRHFPLEGY